MNRLLSFIIAISIGIARSQWQRRRVMFFLTLGALVMLAIGTFPLWSVFVAHPLFFAIYWLAFVWLVICVILLAIYDLLMVFRLSRKEHAEARRKILKDND